MLNEQQIDKLHSKWYDELRNKKGIAPGSFESYLAGFLAAMKEMNKV